MNYTLNNLLVFAAGAAVGAVVTWRFLEARCEQRIRDEVAEVKERFRIEKSPKEDLDEAFVEEDLPWVDEEKETDVNLDMDVYKTIVENRGYTNYSDLDSMSNPNNEPPVIITPEEFGDIDEYGTATYTYYADGVLTDDMDEPVDDIDDVIGIESLDHFGEYEDDVIHVRNHNREYDYEVLRDLRNYSDINPLRHLYGTED